MYLFGRKQILSFKTNFIMKILVIGGSNSQNSINRKFARFVVSLFNDAEVQEVNISQMDVPLFSVQHEKATGIPATVRKFAQQIDETDLILLSLAENNGSYNVGFKNVLDWTSRISGRTTFNQKPMLLMATSPGGRGGATVLESAKNYFPFMGAVIKGTFSLPKFYENFEDEKGITNPQLLRDLNAILETLKREL